MGAVNCSPAEYLLSILCRFIFFYAILAFLNHGAFLEVHCPSQTERRPPHIFSLASKVRRKLAVHSHALKRQLPAFFNVKKHIPWIGNRLIVREPPIQRPAAGYHNPFPVCHDNRLHNRNRLSPGNLEEPLFR